MSDLVFREAVKHLDMFTKTYCRDQNIQDDLVFRCKFVADGRRKMDDTISRQAAIDALYRVDEYNGRSVKAIRNLPSAQPERKMGKWIYNSPVTMKCNQCGFVIKDWDWHRFKFCPNCDCDMRCEQE